MESFNTFNRSYYKVFYNGRVISPKGERGCTSLGIEGDTILLVDRDQRVIEWGHKKGAAFFDLKGRPLLPGFIDTHVHLLSTGIEIASLRIHGLTSISSILDLIRGEVLRTPVGRPISLYSYNELLLDEGRPPLLEELDLVAPHHPVFLSRMDLHSCVLNTAALKRLKLEPTSCGLFSGEEGYRARGRFLGLYTKKEKARAMKEAANLALRAGVTTLHAMEGGTWQGNDAIIIAQEIEEELPLSMVLYPMTIDLDFIEERGLGFLGGDLFLDGSFGSRTAALFKDYSDYPGKKGCLYYSNEDLLALVERAISLGLKIGFHVIGDAAIEQALQVIEKVSSSSTIPEASFRLEHFSLPHLQHRRRAKELGIGIGIQAFSLKSREMMIERLGEERAYGLYPHRRMYEEGLLMAIGSDSNVDAIHPISSMARLMANSFSFHEALTLSTWNGARLVGEEKKGRLAPGMAADLILLDQDPSHLTPSELEGVEVLLTMVGGEIEYSKPEMITGDS